MAAGVILLLHGFLLLLILPSAMGDAWLCGRGGNYTANGTYQSNLASLARTLPGNTASSPLFFFNTTVGRAPDVVYALALCRGDITNATRCSSCVAGTFRTAQQNCPLNKAATIYLDDCLMRFSGNDFLIPVNNITENATFFQFWNSESISGDAAVVGADVQELLNVTAQDAASNPPRRYATVVMDSSSSAIPTLYSMSQCTPDLSAGDCLACLQRLNGMVNATTAVRIGGRMLVMRCNIRFESIMFYDGQPMRRLNSSSSIAPTPPAPAPTSKRLGTRPWVIAVSVAAPVIVLAALCFIIYGRRLRRKYTKGKMRLRQYRANKLRGGDEQVWEMEAELSEFSVFDLHQILEATGDFSEENKLGEGGFGPVYKGQFSDGTEIAVKRLASHSGQGFIEFKNEVQLIAKLQHRNLVRLLGCCSQGEEKILVYEYLPNKSLDFFIFDEGRRALMDWNMRLAIIEGIAEGLLYLHKHSRMRVIHRDLKPSNILLDNEMNPKISDFGLAKIFGSNDTEGSITRRVVGTYGYMAPEYASEGLFSLKSDVFSFGVLMIEILSGKRNSSTDQYGDFINLLGYAWQLWEEERWTDLVDASLLTQTHSTEIARCMNIALLCVQENAIDRPTMLDVVAMLSSKTMKLGEPKHPAYFNVRVGNQEVSSSTATKSSTINDMTISITNPR